jgi:hypothetical protein
MERPAALPRACPEGDPMRILWLVVAALLVPASALADRTVRNLHEDHPAAGLERVRVKFPVGRLLIEASRDGQVHYDVQVRCRKERKCEEHAEEVSLETSVSGGTLTLEIDQRHDWNNRIKLEGVLRMPPELALKLEMGVGEVTLHGLRDDVELNLGVGEANVRMREADVRTVKLSSGVGDATLRVGRRRMEGSGFIGHSVSWGDGSGRARVEVDLGVGDTRVELE